MKRVKVGLLIFFLFSRILLCFPPTQLESNREPGNSWNYAAIFQRVTWGSRSTTPLLRNPTEVRHCSQHARANVDFGDEGTVDWAFLGNLKQLRALLLG